MEKLTAVFQQLSLGPYPSFTSLSDFPAVVTSNVQAEPRLLSRIVPKLAELVRSSDELA